MKRLLGTRNHRARQRISALIAVVVILAMVGATVSEMVRKDAGGVEAGLTLTWINAVLSDNGETVGYRLLLDDPELGRRDISYSINGSLAPLPELGDVLPFDRFEHLDGGWDYRFRAADWRRSYLGL